MAGKKPLARSPRKPSAAETEAFVKGAPTASTTTGEGEGEETRRRTTVYFRPDTFVRLKTHHAVQQAKARKGEAPDLSSIVDEAVAAYLDAQASER